MNRINFVFISKNIMSLIIQQDLKMFIQNVTVNFLPVIFMRTVKIISHFFTE
jgi:hypothetical protein